MKACNETKRCDRLYVDDKALLVNVLIGVSDRIPVSSHNALIVCASPGRNVFQDDQCEALEVPYTTMRKIDVNSKQTGSSVVMICVTTPPVASKGPVKSSPGSLLRIEFTLAGADSGRFHAAIRSRGLVSARPFVVGDFGSDAARRRTSRRTPLPSSLSRSRRLVWTSIARDNW